MGKLFGWFLLAHLSEITFLVDISVSECDTFRAGGRASASVDDVGLAGAKPDHRRRGEEPV